MPDEKVARILLSKTNMRAEEVAALSNSEAWRLVYDLPKKPADNRPRICFTGFGDTDKEVLQKIAEDMSFKVVGSVTKGLSCLCVGENPGPAKLLKAEGFYTPIITGEQFMDFAMRGVVPEKLKDVVKLNIRMDVEPK
jgi:NAD-dependent DNA ligase